MPPVQKAKAKASAKANPAAAVSTPPFAGADLVPHQPVVESGLALALPSQDGRPRGSPSSATGRKTMEMIMRLVGDARRAGAIGLSPFP